FQAEDGIRYFHVTGVQTCALPILSLFNFRFVRQAREIDGGEAMRNETFAKPVAQMRRLFTLYHFSHDGHVVTLFECDPRGGEIRSEERRVGKECRSRGST